LREREERETERERYAIKPIDSMLFSLIS